MESLFTLIEFWAGLKYNQLQLYMEHTFAYRGRQGGVEGCIACNK